MAGMDVTAAVRFLEKNPTKVDRSAAWRARYVAKNIVAAGLARKCEVELAYAIGVARPVSIMVDTFGTGTVDDGRLAEAVQKAFDLRPTAIIKELDLRRPIYRQLAAYGSIWAVRIWISPGKRTDVAFRVALLNALRNRDGGKEWRLRLSTLFYCYTQNRSFFLKSRGHLPDHNLERSGVESL